MTITYIVDASVVIQFLVTDTYTPQTQILLTTLGVDDQLCVPEFCLIECANVIWKQVRFQGMSPDRAKELTEDLIDLPLVLARSGELLARALDIGLSQPLAIYDSLYIVLAQDLNCPLITVDQRQAQAARAGGVSLKPITDFMPA